MKYENEEIIENFRGGGGGGGGARGGGGGGARGGGVVGVGGVRGGVGNISQVNTNRYNGNVRNWRGRGWSNNNLGLGSRWGSGWGSGWGWPYYMWSPSYYPYIYDSLYYNNYPYMIADGLETSSNNNLNVNSNDNLNVNSNAESIEEFTIVNNLINIDTLTFMIVLLILFLLYKNNK